jgi:hypothetical protein
MHQLPRIVVYAVLLAGLMPIVTTSALVRPGPPESPTPVKVSLYVVDVENIDDVAQTFRADIVLRARWKDPAVAFDGARPELDEIWHPNLQIANLRSGDQAADAFVELLDDDTVQITHRLRGELASRLDLHDFPFDMQRLTITLLAVGYSVDDVSLEVETTGAEPSFSIPGWVVNQRDSEVGTFYANLPVEVAGAEPRPIIQFHLSAERHVSFYRWRVLAPLSLVVFLSWAVFWIDPQNLNPQVSVAATSILTLIAYFMSLSELLPHVSHLTLLDEFVFACLCFVFLAYVEAVATSRMARDPKRLATAVRLDRGCRIVFPIAYAAIVLFYWA